MERARARRADRTAAARRAPPGAAGAVRQLRRRAKKNKKKRPASPERRKDKKKRQAQKVWVWWSVWDDAHPAPWVPTAPPSEQHARLVEGDEDSRRQGLIPAPIGCDKREGGKEGR